MISICIYIHFQPSVKLLVFLFQLQAYVKKNNIISCSIFLSKVSKKYIYLHLYILCSSLVCEKLSRWCKDVLWTLSIVYSSDMSTMFWKLDLPMSSGKKQGWRRSAYTVIHVKQVSPCYWAKLQGPITKASFI
jgi:hypothetical protein